MISYSWQDETLVLKLRDALKARGIPLWMDRENLHSGALFESIAKSIEETCIFIACFSESYFKSAYCRAEAAQAFKKKKPIIFVQVQEKYETDGWLSVLMGVDLYYEITGDKFPRESQRIIQEIARIRQSPPEEATDSAHSLLGAAGHAQRAAKPSTASNLPEAAWQRWSVEQVGTWLDDFGLQDYKTRLIFFHHYSLIKRMFFSQKLL